MRSIENTKTWASAWLKNFGQGTVCRVGTSLHRETICEPSAFAL